MGDTEPRRTARARNAPVSYKEPGELAVRSLEGSETPSDVNIVTPVKPRTPASVSSQKRRLDLDGGSAAGTPSSQKRKRDSGPVTSFTADDSLLGIIRTKPSAISMAVKQWWDDYHKNSAAAVRKLTNMVLQVAGISNGLPPHCFAEEDDERDVDDYIRQLVETSAAGENEMAMHMTGSNKQSKKFRENFSDFWDKFVAHAPESELISLHDNPFCPWLHAMSTSQLMILRLVAVVAGLEIMLALVGKANDSLDAMNTLERLYDAAKSKKGKGEAEKLTRLQEQLESKKEIRAHVEETLSSFFNSIIVHRHRDTSPEIRTKSIQAIGSLVLQYKSKFLENSYLKYIGWALYDKHQDVRSAALSAIGNMYEDGLANELEMFTSRFKDRVLQMRLDKDKSVSVTAVETALSMAQKELLDAEQIEEMYAMITESDLDIRHAAAGFIQSTYVEQDLEKAFDQASKKSKKAINKEVFLLKGMVELLNAVAGDFEELQPMVDALLPHMEYLQDFALLCDVLAEDDSGDDTLNTSCKTTLANMILGSFTMVSGHDSVDDGTQRQGKAKKATSSSAACKAACLTLAQRMPGLLRKFATDPKTLTPLIEILQRLVLTFFSSNDKTLKEIADLLVDVTRKAQEATLLKACAGALANFADTDYSSKSAVKGKLNSLYDSLAKELKKASEACTKGQKLNAVMVLSVRRVCILSGYLDVFAQEPLIKDHAMSMLGKLAEDANLFSSECGCLLLNMGLAFLIWRMESGDEPDIPDIVEARGALLEHSDEIMRSSNGHPMPIRVQAMVTVADAAHLFGRYMESKDTDLEMSPSALQQLGELAREILATKKREGVVLSDGTLNLPNFPHDDQDEDTVSRLAAASVLKGISYYTDCDNDLLVELLTTITLYRPFANSFHTQALKLAAEGVRAAEDESQFWLLAHRQMFTHISEAVSSKQKSAILDMTMALTDSVTSLKLSGGDATKQYLSKGLVWALEDVTKHGHRLGFLDALGLQMKNVSASQAGEILSKLEEVCTKKKIELPDDEGGEEAGDEKGGIQNLVKFRRKLRDISEGGAGGSRRERPPPRQRSIEDTPGGGSNDGDEGAASSSKAGSKRKMSDAPEESEDGWSTASGKRKKS